MQFITQYLYRQKIPCQISELLETNRRTVSVYNRDIKAYRGVANKFLIEVKNQDQKPINISSRDIKLNILNSETNTDLFVMNPSSRRYVPIHFSFVPMQCRHESWYIKSNARQIKKISFIRTFLWHWKLSPVASIECL